MITCRIMKNISIVLCVFSLSACTSGTNDAARSAQENNTPNIERVIDLPRTGQEIFDEKCMMCHGLGGNRRYLNAEDLRYSRIDSLSIVQTIINGKGDMPAFLHQFTDSEMISLVDYVKHFRTQ